MSVFVCIAYICISYEIRKCMQVIVVFVHIAYIYISYEIRKCMRVIVVLLRIAYICISYETRKCMQVIVSVVLALNIGLILTPINQTAVDALLNIGLRHFLRFLLLLSTPWWLIEWFGSGSGQMFCLISLVNRRKIDTMVFK